MRYFTLVTASIGSIFLGTPAWAGYVEATYSGTVEQVAAGAPGSLGVGTPIMFDVVFDPSRLVDYTANVNSLNHLTGANAFTSFQTVSLSDDPAASLTITVGGITFSKFDQVRYGTPCSEASNCNPAVPTSGLGAGNLPDAEYLNGSFAGVGNIFVNAQGYSLDADPIADYLIRLATNGQDEFGLGGPRTGDFDFYLGQGTVSRPFTTGLAVGNIDIADVRISTVPEPSTWALLLTGVAVMGGVLRFASAARKYSRLSA